MEKASQIQDLTQRLPTKEEVESAAEAATALAMSCDEDGSLLVGSGERRGQIKLAPALTELLVDVLREVASGNMITVVPTGAMLTTQEAADLLNVSRPFLSKLLKEGQIPFVPVGSHRRVKLQDLVDYKVRRDANRQAVINELMQAGQEFDQS
ncbi:MAG: helix-turn-helix domain-containing protein [Myxococcota bacterium]